MNKRFCNLTVCLCVRKKKKKKIICQIYIIDFKNNNMSLVCFIAADNTQAHLAALFLNILFSFRKSFVWSYNTKAV